MVEGRIEIEWDREEMVGRVVSEVNILKCLCME